MARGLRGVRDDLSEIARHLLDAACFLGPLLPSADSPPPSPRRRPSAATSRALAGVLRDLRELAGGFRGGVSWLLSNAGDEDGPGSARGGGAGLGEELVEFVRELVECPESWVEFPVPVNDDFEMTRPQREHIATAEHLVPSLAALRISLCPNHMSEESFWKIYFALLHPKLNKHDSELLSTKEIMESMRKMQKKMLNRVNIETERLMMVSSNEGINTQAEDNQAGEALRVPDTTLQQSIHQQLETPNDSDTSIVTKKQRSEADFLFSDREEDDHVILGKKYATLPPMGVCQIPPYTLDNRVQLRKRHDSFGDLQKAIQQSLQDKELVDGESSDWQDVEDSDFEIVESTS